MKRNFLTENRRLLQLSSNIARFYGLLALLGTGVLIVTLLIAVTSGAMDASVMVMMRTELFPKVPIIVFYGFAALIIADFMSFLVTSEDEPKWILKHGDKIIYVYVLYCIIGAVFRIMPSGRTEELLVLNFSRILDLTFFGLRTAARVLIWVGIAITLRKIVPIIKESKTLV